MISEEQDRYPHLFSPLEVGGARLKNRIVFPAIMNNYARQGLVTDRTVTFYAERAAGGAAMVVSEGLFVHPSPVPAQTTLAAYEPANIAGFERLAAAVEEHDCRMIGQLMHSGRQQVRGPVSDSSIGVSSLPDPYSWTVPHVMSTAEVRMMVEAFVASAGVLQRAGFSGVEVHAAHGHLITQFLSPWSNTRQDEYGGDLDGRTRFLREVLAGIRSVCGTDFVLGLKMPGDELVEGGITAQESARIANRVSRETPPDYLAFGQGNSSLSFGDHVPDMHYPPGPYLGIQRDLNAAVSPPVLAFGRVTSAAQAEAVIRDGTGDLVGLGRLLVADPGFPAKVRAGREREVRPCVYCNVCWGEVTSGRTIACVVNPDLGTDGEAARPVRRSPKRREVTVVGAGVAGLQAAAAAAEHGHRVTLLAGPRLGGKAGVESMLPGRGDITAVLEHQRWLVERNGVRVEQGAHATEEAVLATGPDVVVLATGAHMMRPPTLGADSEDGVSVRDYLARDDAGNGDGTAVLFDFDHSAGTYAVADLLARRYRDVVVMTARTSLGDGVPYVSRLGVHRRLHEAGVRIELATEPLLYKDHVLRCANVFTGQLTEIEDVALFTWSTPRRPVDELSEPLSARGVPVHVIGDAYAPGTMLTSIREAEMLGRRL
ncbi:FAD-dependent oxidoreductase [Lentzea sp. NEAU-D7]|uniref:oxidoreductase n=1 Tax=Lentzea sp. NEAU-D7 TaxID=2994667 RepID=UPI00224B3D6F|nr:FAD-dependent oxidoreductase [Lentzea sp. NEAU-D7]MCX2950142.1 FAD-dependent oxidoreductase [Lentzea sp. NEAU-D7]